MTTNIMETSKSTKKEPFTSSERELIPLVCERPIIESKQTNARNIELKKQAWEDLTLSYNSQPYVSQRTSTQLKRCWENIKEQRKKELSQESAYVLPSNIIDIICPHINLQVPGAIDSNTIEISDDVQKENFDKCVIELPDEKDNMLTTQTEARVHRCTKNIQNDQELHEIRLQREKIILERVTNPASRNDDSCIPLSCRIRQHLVPIGQSLIRF